MSFSVELDPPPSANTLYLYAPKGRVKAPHYRAWRKKAVLEIYAQVPAAQRIPGKVNVLIELPIQTRSDVDNNCKAILDALVDSQRIDDDRNVVKVEAQKTIVGRRARVTVRPALPQLGAPDLKTVIVDAALAGQLTTREAEDLISEYGLRHE